MICIVSLDEKLEEEKIKIYNQRLKDRGLLEDSDRFTKVVSSEGEIWYYDYNTDNPKFIVYFKSITSSINYQKNTININVEFF